MSIEAEQVLKSPEEVSKDTEVLHVVGLSYFYSQSDTLGQQAILEWFIGKTLISREDILTRKGLFESNFKMPKFHKEVFESDIELSIDTEFYKLSSAFYDDWGIKHLERNVLMSLIHKDEKYQRKKRPGRPDKQFDQIEPDSMQDKHASFLRRYVLQAHPSGHPGFDELFQNIEQNVQKYMTQENPEESAEYRELMYLSKLWENNHPGHSFFPPHPDPLLPGEGRV